MSYQRICTLRLFSKASICERKIDLHGEKYGQRSYEWFIPRQQCIKVVNGITLETVLLSIDLTIFAF
jgi:hypothetical protein